MIIAREHRGGLTESMATVKTFNTKEEMVNYFTKMWSKWYGRKVKITIDEQVTRDDRIGWNTQYILCDGYAVGMCDLNYKKNEDQGLTKSTPRGIIKIEKR